MKHLFRNIIYFICVAPFKNESLRKKKQEYKSRNVQTAVTDVTKTTAKRPETGC